MSAPRFKPKDRVRMHGTTRFGTVVEREPGVFTPGVPVVLDGVYTKPIYLMEDFLHYA